MNIKPRLISAALATMLAFCVSAQEVVTDTISVANLGIKKSTLYSTIKDFTHNSNTNYVVRTLAYDENVFQIAQATAAIYTTTSSGCIHSISPNWDNPGSYGDSDLLQIYGKNEPYSTPDLSNQSTLGTLICSIKPKSDNDKPTLVQGDYRYILVVPQNSVHLFKSISFSWREAGMNVPQLSFSAVSYTATYGEPFTAPTLINPDQLPISYSSSNTEVAEVSATGEIIVKAAGTTTITASSIVTENATAVSTSYELNVVVPTGFYAYNKVTSEEDIIDDGVYMLVNETNKKVMSSFNSSQKWFDAISFETNSNGEYIGNVDGNGLPYVFKIIGAKDGKKYIEIDKKYLKSSSSTSTATKMTLENNASNATIWTISLIDDKVTIEDSVTSRFLYYNSSYIKNYSSSSYNPNLTLYKRVIPKLDIKMPQGYATFYSDKAFIMPVGVKGGIVSQKDEKTVEVDYIYTAGQVVPAFTALILKAAQGSYEYSFTTSSNEAPENNLLKGMINAGSTPEETVASYYYALSLDQNETNPGFYWMNTEGSAFDLAANRAYLVLPKSMQVERFVLDNDAMTNISNIQPAIVNEDVYTLQGVRCSNAKLAPGIYIKGGKKVLVR